MPDVVLDQLRIPFGGRSPRAKRASLQGALVCKAGSQAARLLVSYVHYGPSTDLQMAERLGLPESRISARRSGLIKRQQVEYAGFEIQGPHKAENCVWQLTGYGRETAKQLARAL